MYKCLNCERVVKTPNSTNEFVAVGEQFLNYSPGIECPTCKGDLERISFTDEVYDILRDNFDNMIDLSDEEVDEIVKTIKEELSDMQPEFWFEIRYRLLELISLTLKDKLKALEHKDMVSSLTEDEKRDLETLILWEREEL